MEATISDRQIRDLGLQFDVGTHELALEKDANKWQAVRINASEGRFLSVDSVFPEPVPGQNPPIFI